MLRRPPRSTLSSSSAASDVYKRQPYIYTKYAEEFAKEQAGLEPRIAGTIACFAGQPLQHGITAKAWKKSGFVVER